MLNMQQYTAWAIGDYQRMIALAIAINSRAVYNFLKANQLLGPNWAVYAERTEQNRQIMANLLNNAANRSGNQLKYAQMLINTIPIPTLIEDINYAVQAVERLMRNNPKR